MDEYGVIGAFLIALVTFAWGSGASFLQERFGFFQSLDPKYKELFNASSNLVLPGIVAFLSPYWIPELGDLNGLVLAIGQITFAVAVWAVSLYAHSQDPAANK